MRGLTRAQAESVLSDYSGLKDWWCECCEELCKPKAIDGGWDPNHPKPEAISSCCWMRMTDVDPVVARAERGEE